MKVSSCGVTPETKTKTWILNVECDPNRITLDVPEKMCPGGRAGLSGSYDGCSFRCDDVEWKLEPADAGTIEPQKGSCEPSIKINEDFEGEKVTVTFSFWGCEKSKDIEIICGGCAGDSCAMGGDGSSGNIRNGPRKSFPTGSTADGDDAGHIFIVGATNPAEMFNGRQVLRTNAHGEGVEVYYNTGLVQPPGGGVPEMATMLSQIRTADALVVVSDYAMTGFQIEYFASADIDPATTSPPYAVLPGVQPITTWRADHPTVAGYNYALELRQYTASGDPNVPGGDPNVPSTAKLVQSFLYDDTPGSSWEWAWTYEIGDPISIVRRATEFWAADPNTFTARREYKVSQDGGTYELVSETWESINGSWYVKQRSVDPGLQTNDELVTTWTRDLTTGQVLAIDYPDGSWVAYDTVVNGTEYADITFRPWLNTTRPGSLATTMTGVQASVVVTDRDKDYRVIRTERWANGRKVSETRFSETMIGGRLQRTAQRYVDATDWLETVTLYTDGTDDEIASITHPNGRVDEYAYSTTGVFTWNSTFGYPETVALTGGNERMRFVTHHGSGGTPVAGKSTQDVTMWDAYGRVTFTGTWAYTTTSEWLPLTWVRTTYDNRGRVSTRKYPGKNNTESYIYSDCCGGRTVTDMDGTTTHYREDLLGRPTVTIVDALPGSSPSTVFNPNDVHSLDSFETGAQPERRTYYVYSTVGGKRVTTITNVGDEGGVNEVRLSTVYESDWAGRTTREVDAAGLVTTYSYADVASDPNGGVDSPGVTQTLPSGQTVVTARFLDGQTRSTWGATTPTFYTYTVPAEVSHSLQTEVRMGSPTSARFARTYVDWLGRTVKEERPAFNSGIPLTTTHTYYTKDDTAAGQSPGALRMMVAKHGTTVVNGPIVYEYDEIGQVCRTAAVPDGNTTINLAGSDRITENNRLFKKNDLTGFGITDLVQIETETYTYPFSNSTPKLISKVVVAGTRLRAYGANPTPADEVRIDQAGAQTTTAVNRRNVGGHIVTTTTTTFDDDTNDVSVHYGGLTQRTTSRSDVVRVFEYDALQRQTRQFEPAFGFSETVYDANTGQTTTVRDTAGNPTTYTYYPTSQLGAGQVHTITNALSKATIYTYNARSQVATVRGAAAMPLDMGYNIFGERTSLKTFRDPNAAGDETMWRFDEATGLLTEKIYADGQGPRYDYAPDGKLKARDWVRDNPTLGGTQRLRTTYRYVGDDPNDQLVTGELTKIDYADATPDVVMSYTRDGRLSAVTDATGLRTFGYDPNTLLPATETFDPTSVFGDLVLTRGYQMVAQAETMTGASSVRGRFVSLDVGTAADPDAYYDWRVKGWSGGRVKRLTGPGLPEHENGSAPQGVVYNYLTGTDFLETISSKNSLAISYGTTSRTYSSDHPSVTEHGSVFQAAQGFAVLETGRYTNDSAGRRTRYAQGAVGVLEAGGAIVTIAPAQFSEYTNNDRGELTDAYYSLGVHGDPNVVRDPNRDNYYSYDAAGNRLAWNRIAVSNALPIEYRSNELNQYKSIHQYDPNHAKVVAGLFVIHDPDGNLTESWRLGDMNCDGAIDAFDISPFIIALNDPNAYQNQFSNCADNIGDINGDGLIDAFDISQFIASLTSGAGGEFQPQLYRFDAENRLIAVEPIPASSGKLVQFGYDYRNRRIEEKVYDWNPQAQQVPDPNDPNILRWVGAWETTPAKHTRFVYDGWRVILELDALNNNAVARRFTWGLDLSGTWEGAGGIGGLLAIDDPNDPADPNDPFGKFLVFGDANGNVTQLVNWEAALSDPNGLRAEHVAAHYEYDPYGRVVRKVGSYAEDNPIRFSTKWFDGQISVGYWGYRFYDPRLGRWLSRDPANEGGGENLYQYSKNQPVRYLDALGLEPITVEFNAFIPARFGTWVNEPFSWEYYYKTDGRGFGGGPARLRTTVTIDSEGIGTCARVKDSVEVQTEGGVSSRKRVYFDSTGVLQQDIQQRKAKVWQSFGWASSKCKTTVTVYARANNPHHPQAPNIDYTVNWEFSVPAHNTVTIRVWGSHDQFPDYEALVHRPIALSQYTYPTRFDGFWGPILGLNLSTDFTGAGVSVPIQTSACCP